MSGSDRSFVLAGVAGITAICISFGIGVYAGALNYPDEERHQPYRYASDKPTEVDPSARRSVGGKPLEYRTPCNNPKGRDESDLCAQWRAAQAAEQSALWAKWSFWVGLGGVIGLFWTLYYTRKAVQSTADATRAMTAANSAQFRPYVTFTPDPTDDEEEFSDRTKLQLIIKNFGQVPATSVKVSINEKLAKIPVRNYDVNLEDNFGDFGIVAPGDHRVLKIEPEMFTTDEINQIVSNKLMLIVRARIDYAWPDGADHHDVTMALIKPSKNEWNIIDERRRKIAKAAEA